MSKFITRIPVDFAIVAQGVPKNTFIHSAQLSEDRQAVEVIWDNPAFESPVQGPWPFPIEDIRNGTLPERVTLADWVTQAKPEQVPAAEVPAVEETGGVGNKAVVPPGRKRNR
jgi:hypothetical protein